MNTAKEGDMKVWWIPQVPGTAFEVPVASAEQGAFLLSVLAEYDAFQLLTNIKPDYYNVGGLMVFEDGEWCDWQCPDTCEWEPQNLHPQPSLGWCANLPK